MLLKQIGLSGVLGLGLWACSGSSDTSGGSGAISQTLVGSTWGAPSTNTWLLRIASYDNVCDHLHQMTEVANSSELEVTMTAPSGQTSLQAGTYAITTDSTVAGAKAKFKMWDGTCTKLPEATASSGTVTLTTAIGVTGASANGSYDLHFPDGSRKSGTFSAPACDVFTQGGAGCVGGTASGSGGVPSPGTGGATNSATGGQGGG